MKPDSRRIVVALAVALLAITAWAQQTKPARTNTNPQPKPDINPQPKPARVRAKLGGFDLSPQSGKTPNQIGGGSRDLGVVTLYAPRMGKAYTLTPTFWWSSDSDQTPFSFKLSNSSLGQNPIYESNVKGGFFTYPENAPTLSPGTTYIWSVEPATDIMNGASSASLVIVSGPDRAAVEAALAETPGAGAEALMAQAKIYTDARLWYDAVAAYSSLIERFPQWNDLYQARAQIYDQFPQTQPLADADFAKIQKK
jgi:hypothetical protein